MPTRFSERPPQGTAWRLFAHDMRGGLFHIGSRKYVDIHQLDHPIVEVLVEVNDNGTYYGWMRRDGEVPSMIWPHETLFNVCFPYGPKVAEEKGDGWRLRFRVSKVE